MSTRWSTIPIVAICAFAVSSCGMSSDMARAEAGVSQPAAADFRTEVEQFGARAATLVVSSTRTISTSLTVGSNIGLTVHNTGLIVVAADAVLTIDGPFQAGRHRVFAGEGRVRFGPNSVSSVSPHWFEPEGAKTDFGDGINRAVASLTQGGEVQFEAGTYRYRTTIVLPALVRLIGRGLDTSTLLYEGTGHAVSVPGSSKDPRVKVGIEHLGIHGNPKALDGLWATYAPYSRFRNVRWYGFRTGVAMDHSWGSAFENSIADFNRVDGFHFSTDSNHVTLTGCSGNNNGRAGLVINGARGSAVYAGNFEANAKYGVYVLADAGKPVSGIDLRGGYFEGNEIDILVASADRRTMPSGITIEANYFLPLAAARTAIRVDHGQNIFIAHNTFDGAKFRYDSSVHLPDGSQTAVWGPNNDMSVQGVRREGAASLQETTLRRSP